MPISNKATIVMYHYVRDFKNSKYPQIRGIDIKLFEEQMQYIIKHYQVITMEDLIAAVKKKKVLPANSLLLTFDDAYQDHFEFVFAVLDKLKIQGSFFIPVEVTENKVLIPNKIQFILASVKEEKQIIREIFSILNEFRQNYPLPSNEYYYQKLAVPNRYDTKEVTFIKKILQYGLPPEIGSKIINLLFNKYVSTAESSFAQELYMNIDQIKFLKKQGMYIGSHGYNHHWLNTMSREKQQKEIQLSLNFLKEIGCDVNNFTMCYPYGAYNDSLIKLLQENGCVLALTVKVGIADLSTDHPLALPRLDTNDLPKDRFAKPNTWTLKANS